MCPVFCRVLGVGRAWHDSFVKNRRKMEENLHVLQPVMRTILQLCHSTFSGLLLVDLSGCRCGGCPGR